MIQSVRLDRGCYILSSNSRYCYSTRNLFYKPKEKVIIICPQNCQKSNWKFNSCPGDKLGNWLGARASTLGKVAMRKKNEGC